MPSHTYIHKKKKKLHPLEEGNPSAYVKCTCPTILNCYIARLNIADFECITFLSFANITKVYKYVKVIVHLTFGTIYAILFLY